MRDEHPKGFQVRLSIVIPVYNLSDVLSRTFTTLTALEPAPYEVVVVDDGSTDGSAAIAASVAQTHPELNIKVVRQPNSGVSVARNVGLTHATGDYVLFLDGDDTVEPNLIRELIKAHSGSSGFPDVYCWRYRRTNAQPDDSNSRTWEAVLPLSTGAETLRRMILERNHSIWTGSAAYRIEFLRARGLQFHPGCNSGEDLEFIWKTLSLTTSVRFIDAYLSTYINTKGSITNTMDIKRFDGVLAYHRAARFLADRDDPALHDVGNAISDKVIPRFIDYLKIIARTHPDTPGRLLVQIEKRNPGITRLIRLQIWDHIRSGKALQPSWAIMLLSPHAWVLRTRRQARHRDQKPDFSSTQHPCSRKDLPLD